MRVLIAALTLLVAACGFQPMYATSANGGPAIGPVQISQIDGKAGHVLKTELERILAVENNGAPPATLEIALLEQVTALGLRRDESATRGEIRLTATYTLTPASGGEAIRGTLYTVVNYEIPTAAFGEIAAQDDARERAAESMAQRFRAELALRMAQARAGSAGR
jgi:LPS-assembly lipoprotein